jgi:hypothetical protein
VADQPVACPTAWLDPNLMAELRAVATCADIAQRILTILEPAAPRRIETNRCGADR